MATPTITNLVCSAKKTGSREKDPSYLQSEIGQEFQTRGAL